MALNRFLLVPVFALFALLSACGSTVESIESAESAESADSTEAAAAADAAEASEAETDSPDSGEAASSANCPPEDGSGERQTAFDAPHDMCIDPTKTYTAVMDTTLGEVTIELDAAAAPNTVNNFVTLSRYGFYEGIIFHRVIDGFMAQGGDPTGTGMGGPGYEFADELPDAGEYEIGSVAMANAGPNTNGSQFFLVSGPSGVGLPPAYSLFGQITDGLDVLDTLQSVPTEAGDRPVEDVVINSVTITEN